MNSPNLNRHTLRVLTIGDDEMIVLTHDQKKIKNLHDIIF